MCYIFEKLVIHGYQSYHHIIKHDVGASQGPLDTIFKEEVRKVLKYQRPDGYGLTLWQPQQQER